MSSMELIKKLRDTTGSGIVDCKKALSENKKEFLKLKKNKIEKLMKELFLFTIISPTLILLFAKSNVKLTL